jgi:transposase
MLITRNPSKLDDDEQQLIARIEMACPTVGLPRPLVKSFSEVILGKEAAALQPWLDRANALGLPAIKNFCNGLVRDRSAVTAAISLKWSNGQVEGQVHRLKLIKRQMYGRASFALLRARVRRMLRLLRTSLKDPHSARNLRENLKRAHAASQNSPSHYLPNQ